MMNEIPLRQNRKTNMDILIENINKLTINTETKSNNNNNDKDFEVDLPLYIINREKLIQNRLKKQHTTKDRNNDKCIANIPLLIQDILKLNIHNDFGKNLSAYGVKFDTVMVYGNCLPNGKQSKPERMLYILDDGTEQIDVKYYIHNQCSVPVQKLRTALDYNMNMNNTNKYLDNILKEIEKNMQQISIPDENIPIGAQVCVIGTPYKLHNKYYLYAKEIYIDNDQNRDKELYFKRHLIHYYSTRFKNRFLNEISN